MKEYRVIVVAHYSFCYYELANSEEEATQNAKDKVDRELNEGKGDYGLEYILEVVEAKEMEETP